MYIKTKAKHKTTCVFCDINYPGRETSYCSVSGLESAHHHVVSARSGPLYVGRRAGAAPRVGASRSAASWPGHGGPDGRSSATSTFGEQATATAAATAAPSTSPSSVGSWRGSWASKPGRSPRFAVWQQDAGRYSFLEIYGRILELVLKFDFFLCNSFTSIQEDNY